MQIRDPRLLLTNSAIASSGPQQCAPVMPNKDIPKTPDYAARIQQLESSMQKWNQAQSSWLKERKKLEFEKAEFQRQCDQLQRSNTSLQNQLRELKVKLKSRQPLDDAEQQARKKPKGNSSPATTSSVVPAVPPVPPTAESSLMDTTPSEEQSTVVKSERPPPIFVYGLTNYADFARFLTANSVEDCTRRETAKELILNTQTADQYRKLHSVLRKECADKTNSDKFGEIQLHSYQLKSERAFIVYFCGLPRTMDPAEIAQALKDLHFIPRRITNVQKRENGQLLLRPLFRIELEPNPINPTIYNLTSILQVRIKVEAFKPRTEPPFCRKCQRTGHTRQYCLRSPHCIKCGEGHESTACQLQSTDPCTCANCGGPHPASYRGCPEHQKLRKKQQHSAVEEMRRRGVAHSNTSSAHSAPTTTTSPPGSFAAVTASSASGGRTERPPTTPTPSPRRPQLALMHQPVSYEEQTLALLSALTTQVAELTKRIEHLETSDGDSEWSTVRHIRKRCND